jgi:hypothetical protein
MTKQEMQNKLNEIIESLKIIETKLDVYSRTDRLAYGFHYEKYKALDMECLDLISQLREEVCPPDHSHLTNEDKEI